jgi:N-glycosylase/DNA lyase
MELYGEYLLIKSQVEKRLSEFEKSKDKDEQILKELVFCLCTPQTDAHKAWSAVEELWSTPERKNLKVIAKVLRKHGVRFHNNKADRIFSALETYPSSIHLRSCVSSLFKTIRETKSVRNALSDLTPGLGLKEASHFLRNIGYGNDICILDRHILRKLKENKVIQDIPKLSDKKYLEIEGKMIEFAKKKKIPVAALDLVFWYQAKKEIFK